MPSAIFDQQFMKPGIYDVDGESFELTAEELAEYIANTRRMMEEGGLSVPVLFFHDSEQDWSGPQDQEEDSRNGAGWMRQAWQDEQGDGFYRLELTDPQAAQKAEEKSIRFTSPEFVSDFTDGKGRNWGNVIRHVALTSKPRNPDQSDLQKSQQFSIRFSLENYKGPAMAKSKQFAVNAGQMASIMKKVDDAGQTPGKHKSGKKEGHSTYDPDKMEGNWSEEEEEAYKDMSEEEQEAFRAKKESEDTDDAEMAEEDGIAAEEVSSGPDIASLVSQACEATGAFIPEGTDATSENGLAIVLTALLNKLDTPAETDPMMEDEDEMKKPQEALGVPFSESALKKLDPSARALAEHINRQEKKIAQFSEERNREKFVLTRERAKTAIQTATIPPGLKKELLAKATAVQFSEGETSLLAAAETAKMVAKYMPKNFQFGEGTAKEVENPNDGAGRVKTIDDARRVNDEVDKSLGKKARQTA